MIMTAMAAGMPPTSTNASQAQQAPVAPATVSARMVNGVRSELPEESEDDPDSAGEVCGLDGARFGEALVSRWATGNPQSGQLWA